MSPPTTGRLVRVNAPFLDERFSKKLLAGLVTDSSDTMLTIHVFHPLGPLHAFNVEVPAEPGQPGMNGATWQWPERVS